MLLCYKEQEKKNCYAEKPKILPKRVGEKDCGKTTYSIAARNNETKSGFGISTSDISLISLHLCVAVKKISRGRGKLKLTSSAPESARE